jgi:N-acetylglucosamine kinase-like BadF-type ATPase
MRAYDGRGSPTKLTDAILAKLGLSSSEDIIRWIYADAAWARVAALVPVVKSCAKGGDEVALGVLEHAVEELACSVKAVVRKLNLNGIDNQHRFPFVMVGGVLEHEEGWDLCKPLISKISEAFPGVQAIRPKVEPAVGAALVAWRHYLDDKKGGSMG